MPQADHALPPGFECLASFVADWGHLERQDARYQRRQELPMERLQAYYDAVAPRLSDIFGHLDQFAFGEPLPAPEALLLRVVMGMTEVAQAVELYGQPVHPQLPKGHSVGIRGLSCA